MRFLAMPLLVGVLVTAPVTTFAQQEPAVGPAPAAPSHLVTAGRLVAIGVGAAAVAVGWSYARPLVMNWLYPPPPPSGWNLFSAISAFETQQAASLGPAVQPVPFYETVAAGLAGAVFGNLAYEIF